MTIEQTNVIDFAATDETTNEIFLVISDHLPWVEIEGEHLWTIFFDRSQVDKDVAIYEPPGGYAPSLNAQITRVAYEAFCAYCPMVNLGRASLTLRLLEAGIRVRTYQFPGQEDFE